MKKLIIFSVDNEDWNGTFVENEVNEEMKEIGIEDTTWIEYVLNHVFDDVEEITADFISVISSNPFKKMNLEIDGQDVSIKIVNR